MDRIIIDPFTIDGLWIGWRCFEFLAEATNPGVQSFTGSEKQMADAPGFAQSGKTPQKWREPPSKRKLSWSGGQGVKVLETRCIFMELEYTEIYNFTGPDALVGTTMIDHSFPYTEIAPIRTAIWRIGCDQLFPKEN